MNFEELYSGLPGWRRARHLALAAAAGLAFAVAAPAAASAAPGAPIPVGRMPFGVAVNPLTATAYVANEAGNTVSVLTN